MKYFIIAGEASGDLHGANLMKAIRKKDESASFQFWGGDRMNAVAGGLLMHYRDVTIMGFVEVLINLRFILGNLKKCKEQILHFNPDVVVLIDYPGFNLRIAEFCSKHGIRTAYYISPKVWAWKENRARLLEKYVDELILIFPFETAYFKKWKVKTTYVGNPLLDEIDHFKADPAFHSRNHLDQRPVIALLPGSRKQEIRRMLPVMTEAAKSYPDHQLVIAGAPSIDRSFYEPFLSDNLHLVFGQIYDLMYHASAAIVCSGTATLETALMNVPQVCSYIGNSLSIFLIRRMVKIKFISLVNLCLDKPCIPELIQEDATPSRISEELALIMPGGKNRQQMLEDYSTLRKLLGQTGASERAADVIVNMNRRTING